MTITHQYGNPTGRNVFRLRDFTSRPQHGFDLERPNPDGYTDLSSDEQLSISEFVDFLISRRKETEADNRDNFYMRDHDNRPKTTKLKTTADTPAGYAGLSEEERFHIYELIGFLRGRRDEKSK